MLEVVLRENDLIWFLFWFSRLETRCQVSEKLKNYKGRGLLDETSLVGLCLFYLMSCISVFSRFTFLHRYNYVFVCKILPGYGRIWDRPHKVWFGKAAFYDVFELISSNPDSVVFKIFLQDFSSRHCVSRVSCPDMPGFRSDPMRYGLEKQDFISFSSLSRRIRTPESLEDFDDILHLQAFLSRFFFKIFRRNTYLGQTP